MFQAAPASVLTPAASEPMRTTVCRSVAVALALGTAITLVVSGIPQSPDSALVWLLRVVSVLWFSFGGHYVELAYLRYLLPLLPAAWLPRFAVRLWVWYSGGALLWPCAVLTCSLLAAAPLPHLDDLARAAAAGGLGFIGIELATHTVLYAIGWPSLWRSRNGRLG